MISACDTSPTLPHGWNDTQAAWNGGKYDRWVPNKGAQTMTYYTRQDMPFQLRAGRRVHHLRQLPLLLSRAHRPERYHMWTGWVGNDGKGGGPVIDNAEPGYDWTTYPERLERAGVSWKIYQDGGDGLNAAGGNWWGWTSDPYVGNYGDNSLLYFHQYGTPSPATRSPRRRARHERPGAAGLLRRSCARTCAGKASAGLAGSWRRRPSASTRTGRPTTAPGTSRRCSTRSPPTPRSGARPPCSSPTTRTTASSTTWCRHTPPRRCRGGSTVATSNEILRRHAGDAPALRPRPAGADARGVAVEQGRLGNSEMFDHTSLIRFLERASPAPSRLIETNITPWRRAVAGDLTSAFDFKIPNTAPVELPDVSSCVPKNHDRYPDYVPTPPAEQSLPKQEPGLRPLRALPYKLDVIAHPYKGGTLRLEFQNRGECGACFQVRSERSSQARGVSPSSAASRSAISGRSVRLKEATIYPYQGRTASCADSAARQHPAPQSSKSRCDSTCATTRSSCD